MPTLFVFAIKIAHTIVIQISFQIFQWKYHIPLRCFLPYFGLCIIIDKDIMKYHFKEF